MVRVRSEKVERVKDLREKLDRAKAFYLCNYSGLTVAEITELKRRLREKGAVLKVVKNTALHFALKEKNLEELDQFIPGPTALLIAMEDEVEPLKAAFDYSKEISKFSFKGGWLDGRIFGPEELKTIATLPSKKELQAQVVGALNAPIFKLVYSLNWPLQALVFVLEQIRKQKEEVK